MKLEQWDVAICELHHKNKSIVKKTDGGNVPGSSPGWAGKAFVSWVFVAVIIHLAELTEHAAAWLEQQNLLSSESLLLLR